jgi:hypothetical protein
MFRRSKAINIALLRSEDFLSSAPNYCGDYVQCCCDETTLTEQVPHVL